MAPPSVHVVLERLRNKYPDARYELDWSTPLELLVATILAAQCTDERVNRVTKSLFRKYPDAKAYADAELVELEEDVKPTGFYKNKAKTIKAACRELIRRFDGQVPQTMDQMLTLPGVARKTANVVLNTAFNIPSGIIVDTHVARVSRRMGLTHREKPEDIEADLMSAVPREDFTFFGPAMVLHGRYTCTAKGPKCGECIFEDICAKNLGGEAPSAPSPSRAAIKAKAPSSAKKAAASSLGSVPAKAGSPKSKDAAIVPTEPLERRAEAQTQAALVSEGLRRHMPASWAKILAEEFDKPYFKQLERFLAEERRSSSIFPPERDIFSAFELTPYEGMNVLLLGQDPYHDDGQAHGLCFSVRPGVKPPPSLANIYKELQSDVDFRVPNHGYLVHWAKQGMLMLNAVLTVRAHTPNSHKAKGWESFTDAVIRKANEKSDRVVFVLWGGYAQKKEKLIDVRRHVVIKGVHPSPLSAKNGFFGSKPFSAINRALTEGGKPPIDWQLPNL